MKRPKKRHNLPSKAKCLAKDTPAAQLQAAAQKATFAPSEYHCPNPNSRRVKWRPKPATQCPKTWTLQEGRNAVKSAIVNGRVSSKWVNGFPRHIWHYHEGVWYEARTEVGTLGTYHGYPVDASSLPPGLK